ncbi:MAG: T9SS type A sorting domain-containing protein [Ignavibacteriales bacterium]|nr:T9SS type A sorting domain-containing protein [Ignavibacteriales bacterium]
MADFHLTDYSPCIGSGIDSIEVAGVWYYIPAFCFYGNPRPDPAGSMPDIGACENHLDSALVEVEHVFTNPTEFILYQNHPNPFNPSTTFRYSIPTQSKVVIKVFDILGNEIATLMDEEKSVGSYELTWNAEGFPSGVYFYQIKATPIGRQAGGYLETKKMILLR